MAVDMTKLKTSNEAKKPEENQSIKPKSTKLNEGTPAKAPTDDAELTGNASSNSENASEAAPKAQGEETGKKAVVQYIGHGVWRDNAGAVWSATNNEHANILSSRTYSVEEYNKRQDIKFMEQYGEIKVTIV